MTTVRIVITLKPGVLDAQGQAVQQGLRALGYESVSGVRVGKCIELAVPDQMSPDAIDAMCERFLANPLIEEWRVERGNAETPKHGSTRSSPEVVEARRPAPGARP